MFNNLPIEIENMIYKMYFSMNILSEIINRLPVYCTMSDELVTLINKDAFSADPNYFLHENLKRYMVYDYENTESYLCLNCYIYNFPCENCGGEEGKGRKRYIKNLYDRDILVAYNSSQDVSHKNYQKQKMAILQTIYP